MNIQDLLASSATQSNASTSTPSKTDAAIDSLNDTYNNFLLLLTKQLQNQDPLNPMDTAQFTHQLVGFSQVEQQIASNKILERLKDRSGLTVEVLREMVQARVFAVLNKLPE